MEAIVRPETGLLPANFARVALRNLDDGRWQAACELEQGAVRLFEFADDGQTQQRVTHLLADCGFSDWTARETARRLFEPFELVAEWPG